MKHITFLSLLILAAFATLGRLWGDLDAARAENEALRQQLDVQRSQAAADHAVLWQSLVTARAAAGQAQADLATAQQRLADSRAENAALEKRLGEVEAMCQATRPPAAPKAQPQPSDRAAQGGRGPLLGQLVAAVLAGVVLVLRRRAEGQAAAQPAATIRLVPARLRRLRPSSRHPAAAARP